MHRSIFPRRRNSRFTLIELLVVIAIIAILAGMLLPALNQAREKGKSASCMSNVKQLNLMMTMYADAFNGWLCISYDGTTQWDIGYDQTTPGLLAAGLSAEDSKKARVYQCPSMRDLDLGAAWAGNMTGYGYNEFLGPEYSYTHDKVWPGFRINQVRRASEIVQFGDAGYNNNGRKDGAAFLRAPEKRQSADYDLRAYGPGAYRHGHGTNAGFVDGSAKFLKEIHRSGVSGVDGRDFGFLSEDNRRYDPRFQR